MHTHIHSMDPDASQNDNKDTKKVIERQNM